MGLERPRQIILDQDDLLSPEEALQRVANFVNRFAECTQDDIDGLRRTIRPDFKIPVSPRQKLEATRAAQEKLTEEQETLLAYIGTNFQRFIVTGPAGTGKTVLALNDARRLSALGNKTLFLCFNRPLADELTSHCRSDRNLFVNTFDGHASRLADIENISIEGPEDHSMAILMAAERQSNRFDAVIVDEAQDFQSDWWEAVVALLADPESSRLHIFADSAQDIYEGSGLDRFQYTRFPLTKNCRNTAEIARYVHRIGRVNTETLVGATGPQPEFVRVKNREELLRESDSIIRRWYTTYDLRAQHITVLTDRAELREFLTDAKIGIEDAHQEPVAVETIHRFKGLESQAVLCVFDPDSDNPLDDTRLQRLGYVGLSRGRTLLAVLGTGNTLARLRP
jgi:superfamily I DNA and RNA helicase